MTINPVINYNGGTAVSITGREYLSANPTETLIIALAPPELKGPSDGTQLDLLESINWWPKFAKTQEYPFNILAIQPQQSTYHYLLKDVIKIAKARYNPKNIVLVGIGRASVDLYNVLSDNTDPEIKLVIAVSGGSERTGSISRWPVVKGLAWHGVNDSRYTSAWHQDTVDKYNTYHGQNGGNLQFNLLPGVEYEAWNSAFNVNPTQDPSYQFVVSALNLASPASDDRVAELEAKLNEVKSRLITTLNVLKA